MLSNLHYKESATLPAKAQLPDIRQIKALCEKHAKPPFNDRDRGLIACVGLASLNLVDLSLLKVNEVVAENGSIYEETHIPPEYSALGKAKHVYIGRDTYFRHALTGVFQWRVGNEIGMIDRQLYGGLAPESRFFLQDDGSEFDVHYRRRLGKNTLIEPYDMRRHFNKFYLGEGVNWEVLNQAFMLNYWRVKAPDKPADAVKDLVAMTGQLAETIRAKCARNEETIQSILETLYR